MIGAALGSKESNPRLRLVTDSNGVILRYVVLDDETELLIGKDEDCEKANKELLIRLSEFHEYIDQTFAEIEHKL